VRGGGGVGVVVVVYLICSVYGRAAGAITVAAGDPIASRFSVLMLYPRHGLHNAL
jgi:hypothetical protein